MAWTPFQRKRQPHRYRWLVTGMARQLGALARFLWFQSSLLSIAAAFGKPYFDSESSQLLCGIVGRERRLDNNSACQGLPSDRGHFRHL